MILWTSWVLDMTKSHWLIGFIYLFLYDFGFYIQTFGGFSGFVISAACFDLAKGYIDLFLLWDLVWELQHILYQSVGLNWSLQLLLIFSMWSKASYRLNYCDLWSYFNFNCYFLPKFYHFVQGKKWNVRQSFTLSCQERHQQKQPE